MSVHWILFGVTRLDLSFHRRILVFFVCFHFHLLTSVRRSLIYKFYEINKFHNELLACSINAMQCTSRKWNRKEKIMNAWRRVVVADLPGWFYIFSLYFIMQKKNVNVVIRDISIYNMWAWLKQRFAYSWKKMYQFHRQNSFPFCLYGPVDMQLLLIYMFDTESREMKHHSKIGFSMLASFYADLMAKKIFFCLWH